MSGNQRHRHQALLATAVGSGVSLSASLLALGVATRTSTGHASGWTYPCLIAAVVIFLLAVYVLTALLFGWWLPGGFEKHSVPVLVFRDPEVTRRTVRPATLSTISNESMPVTGTSMTTTSTTYVTGIGRRDDEVLVWIVYALVENVPSEGDERREAVARNVHATLRFSDENGVIVEGLPARWSEHEQDVPVERITGRPTYVDLPVDSGAVRIDVALKYPGDSQCYAYNDETRFTTHDLRGIELGPEPVTVDVTVIGADVRSSARYRLTHDGAGDAPPTMTRLD